MTIRSGTAIIKRAYKGRPLYLWSKGQKPGDMSGDGFNGIWPVKD
jgi:predicted lipoprotein with Yx(FWY)xxD motif